MARKRTLPFPTSAEKFTLPPLHARAEFVPSSVNDDDRTAEVVWTTGARVLRGGFWREPYWEELGTEPENVRLDRLNNGAPLLAAHDSGDLTAVMGVVEKAKMSGGKGTATVRFAKAEDDPEADKVFRKVKDGILQNISVGYRVHKMERVEKGDEEKGTHDVMRAVDWEPYELSVVPMGADDGAGFRGAHGNANECVLVTYQERNMADETTTTPTLPGIQPAQASDPTSALVAAAREQRARESAESAAAASRAADEAKAFERERIAEIVKLVRMTKLGDAFADKLIKANTPIDKVRALVLEEIAGASEQSEVSSHFRFEAGEDASEKFVKAAAYSVIERAGHVETLDRAKQVPRLSKYFRDLAPDSGDFGGMSMIDLARASLERRGVSLRGLHGEALIKRALEFRADSGVNTTSDFATLLETAMNKIFLGAYAIIDVTWPRWCGRKSVQDFRTSTFYRPGTFGVLDSVTEAGEFKHKNIPDGMKRTVTPGTKGNIIGLTRRALVNDDLGAFRELAAELGKAAALSIETDAFAMITANSGLGIAYGDGQNVFYARAAGTNIGPTGAMSAATLDGARAVMAKQKDASGNQYLALRPAVWLGPVELGGIAKQFNSSTTDPTDNKAQGVTNKVLNLFRDVVDSPFLSAQSTTRHYLLADPGSNPTFAVAFINGNESPKIESEQLFGYDGMQMKVVLDYGTAVLDYRTAVTCAGA